MSLTEPSLSDRDFQRRWALKTLQIADEANSGQILALILQRLDQNDFVPSPNLEASIAILTEGETNEAIYRRELENALQEEIELFAAHFFDSPVATRLQRWMEFYERSDGCPHLRLRLEQLRPGLQVEAPPTTDASDKVAELAHWVCELSPLRPMPRAELRRKQLSVVDENLIEWEDAARWLRHQSPEIYDLQEEFVDDIAARTARTARQQRLEQRARRRGWFNKVAASASVIGSYFGKYAGPVFAAFTVILVFAGLIQGIWKTWFESPPPPPHTIPIYTHPGSPPTLQRIDPEVLKQVERLLEQRRSQTGRRTPVSSSKRPPDALDRQAEEMIDRLVPDGRLDPEKYRQIKNAIKATRILHGLDEPPVSRNKTTLPSQPSGKKPSRDQRRTPDS